MGVAVIVNHKERREERRKEATLYVNKVNSETFCSVCGQQPIEWHHDDHPHKPNARVSSLRTQGASIERIKKEMDRCTPLCRRHHMELDGRLSLLVANQPYKKSQSYVEKKACSCCRVLYKPLRKGMCSGCYNHHSGLRKRKKPTDCGCCEM